MRRVVEMFYFTSINQICINNLRINESGGWGGSEILFWKYNMRDRASQVRGSEIRIFSGVRGSWFRREQRAK
jgi:hypothetical protein